MRHIQAKDISAGFIKRSDHLIVIRGRAQCSHNFHIPVTFHYIFSLIVTAIIFISIAAIHFQPQLS